MSPSLSRSPNPSAEPTPAKIGLRCGEITVVWGRAWETKAPLHSAPAAYRLRPVGNLRLRRHQGGAYGTHQQRQTEHSRPDHDRHGPL